MLLVVAVDVDAVVVVTSAFLVPVAVSVAVASVASFILIDLYWNVSFGYNTVYRVFHDSGE